MDEVRSYWQVASISHFCNIFKQPFKLPTFEPEDLEQAFILDIPTPTKPTTTTTTNNASTNDIINHNTNNNVNNNNSNINNDDNTEINDTNTDDNHKDDDDPDWLAPSGLNGDNSHLQAQSDQQPQKTEPEQQKLHLLVKLAIALLKPHFNCKISHENWENYLRRIVDSNWVELEHHPSPFRVPLVSQDGIELTKNLVFNELPLSDKIDLFFALCDYRLWCEDASETLKDYPIEELRLGSVGKDSQGYEYWYFSGTRLFRENKELSQDIILRKKRIKELEYKLVELEKDKIIREQEEKRRLELDRARQLAAEAREARLVAKEQAANKRRKTATPILPPRTGLRERRSSATGNNNDSQQSRTTRSNQAKQPQSEQQHQTTQKTPRGSAKTSKHNGQDGVQSPELPKKAPMEECKDELERLAITPEDRAAAWGLQCESLEDWEAFAAKFEKTKSTNERNLSIQINEYILPNIRAIYAKKAAEAKRKEKELILSLAARRVSTRITIKRAQEEEEERQAKQEAEIRRKKIEAEARLRAELERVHQALSIRDRPNGVKIVSIPPVPTFSDEREEGGRYNLRQLQLQEQHQQIQQQQQQLQLQAEQQQQLRQQQRQHQQQEALELLDSIEFEGIIHPDSLSEFYEALELVIDTVRTSKHAWPFVDPVPTTVPGYYDLIKEPMDLKKLRTKIEFREYKSLIELEKDFQKLVNNCEIYNGPKNVYTKMVYKLWRSFRKNVRLYLQRDLSMDEYETFRYPPPLPPMRNPIESKSIIRSEPEPQPEPMDLEQQPNGLDHEPARNFKSNQDLAPVQDPVPEQEPKPVAKLEPIPEVKPELIPDVGLKPEFEQEPAQPDSDPEEEPKAPTPEPIIMGEEIIIDSYDVPCPDESFFIWSQEAKPT